MPFTRNTLDDCSLGEGVNEILDAARLWAGYTPIDDKGRDVWPKRVTIVERGLFDLVQVRVEAFFGLVWRLKLLGIGTSNLVYGQHKFKRKLDAMEGTLKRARMDPDPTFRIRLLMRAFCPRGLRHQDREIPRMRARQRQLHRDDAAVTRRSTGWKSKPRAQPAAAHGAGADGARYSRTWIVARCQ